MISSLNEKKIDFDFLGIQDFQILAYTIQCAYIVNVIFAKIPTHLVTHVQTYVYKDFYVINKKYLSYVAWILKARLFVNIFS